MRIMILTLANFPGTICVNAEKIRCFCADPDQPDRTRVYVDGVDLPLLVRETPETIVKWIRKEER